ncbi:MAG: nucleoside deaminase [Wenzhouxiangellaceae bacterium]
MTIKACMELRVRLPDWCNDLLAGLPECIPDENQRLRLAVELSRLNVTHRTGGPFGAVVCQRQDGRILGIGVNRVVPEHCSSAHAEIVALSLAQQAITDWNLASAGDVELATSCEPCAMCLGAVCWAGISHLRCAATKADAELAGFDEGPRDPDWLQALARRGIDVGLEVGRDQARAVLLDYRDQGAKIYNPR